MRFIDKQAVCKTLQRRQKNLPTTELSAKKAWRRCNKQAIRKACYKQQFGLCAYTELSLDDQNMGHHLEHIAPRSRFPERTFDRNNLLLVAMNDLYSGQLDEQQRFGGHFKQSQYDESWFISPFNPRCERYFKYCAETGLVNANTDLPNLEQQQATRTIQVLNLNCDYLVNKRATHLDELKHLLEAALHSSERNDLSPEFKSIRSSILIPQQKKLPPFYSAKKQLIASIEVAYLLKNHPNQ